MNDGDKLFCPFCDSWMAGKKCDCGKTRDEIEKEQKKLNREANRRMGFDHPAVVDEPWGRR